MKRRLSPKEARRILKRAPERFSFWLCTNEMLRSLKELGDALNKADDNTFRYHISRDKNDFENWIKDVIQDKDLARDISRIKTLHTLVRKIYERIDELKKIAKASERVKKVKKRKKIKKRRKKIRKKVKRVKKRVKKKKQKRIKKKAGKVKRGKRRKKKK